MSGALAVQLDAACREFAETAEVADEHERFTLAEFSSLAETVAHALRGAGARENEPVGVLVSNKARDLAVLLGVWRAGCVVAPLHRTTPALALQELLERLGSRFVLDCLPPAIQGHVNGEGRFGPGGSAIPIGPSTGILHVLERPPPPPRPLLEDAALIIFTSGTTGLPKGAVLSHRAFLGKLEAIDTLLRFSPATRTVLVLQITFSFGIWVSLLTLLRGGKLLMRERFTADGFLPALREHRATTFALVPTMLRAYLARRSAGTAPIDTASTGPAPTAPTGAGELEGGRPETVEQVLTGGENLGALLGECLRALFPSADMVDIYGLTETSTSDFFLLPADQPRHLGCIGRPSPGVEFRIAGDDGSPAAAGMPGELQIRTPYIMNGYLDAPDLTAGAFAEGYFRTGDLAREKEPGLVELVGRAKEMISRGAAKVAPLEIEQVLCGHPGVAEALATGVPDPLMGERIHVMIVPRAGCRVDESELQGWVSQRLEKFKRPDAYHFGEELPVGRTGKADRGALQKLLGATVRS